MKKVYSKQVQARATEIVQLLVNEGFFETVADEASTEFAEHYILGVLTEKFIEGKPLDLGDEIESDKHLDVIIGGTICKKLKKLGLLDSYEDEETPEVFFMTEKGKLLQEKLKENLPIDKNIYE